MRKEDISQQHPETIDKEPWRAGGYSIWLTSTSLARIITPIATYLKGQYDLIYPVNDGHITLVGNIGKGITESHELLRVEQTLRHTVVELKQQIQNQPFTLEFTHFLTDSSKPSQTLCLVAQESPTWMSLYRAAQEKLGLSPGSSQPMIHASIIYNYCSEYPFGSEVIQQEILPIAQSQMRLPLTTFIDDVVGIKTVGVPNDWKQVT